MFSTKNIDRKALINDLVKSASILVAIHVLSRVRASKKLFDEESLYNILFILLGIIFYHVVVVNIIKPL